MRRSAVLVSAWAGATLVTAGVAWGVVRLAGGGVADSALQPLSSAQVDEMGTTSVPGGSGEPAPEQTLAPGTAPSATSTTSLPASSTATGGTAGTVPSSPASTTTTTVAAPSPPPTTTTTVGSSTAPPPTTTTVPPATTTTAAPTTTALGGTRAFTYPEGTVVVRFDGSGVTLVSASPAPGFSVDVESSGPPAVELEFEGDDDDATFRARLEGGGLVVSLERDD